MSRCMLTSSHFRSRTDKYPCRQMASLDHNGLILPLESEFFCPCSSSITVTSWMSAVTGLLIVCSTVSSGADKKKHQSSAPSAFVSGVHRWPVNSRSRRAGDAENVSIWWRHLGPCIHYIPHTWHGEWKCYFYNDYCMWSWYTVGILQISHSLISATSF